MTTKGIVDRHLCSKSIKSATTVTKQMRDEGDSGVLRFTIIHSTTQSSIARLWIALSCRSLSKGPLQGSFCLMVLTSSANQMELPLRLSSHCIFTNVCTFSAVTSMYFSFILTCLLLFIMFFFYICFAFSDETWGKNMWWLLKWYRKFKKKATSHPPLSF